MALTTTQTRMAAAVREAFELIVFTDEQIIEAIGPRVRSEKTACERWEKWHTEYLAEVERFNHFMGSITLSPRLMPALPAWWKGRMTKAAKRRRRRQLLERHGA